MRKLLLHVLLLLGACSTIAFSNPTENFSNKKVECYPTIKFKNTGCQTVKIYLKYGYNVYFYKTLNAGVSYNQSAYYGDEWIFKVNGSSIGSYTVTNCSSHTYEIQTGGCGNGGGDCGSIPTSLYGLMYMGEYNGSKYFCSSDNYNDWNEATATNAATQLGGYLVAINSAGENEFVRNGMMANQIWIGLTDEASEGSFKWISGEPLIYTNWSSGEPNDQGVSSYGADYVVLEKSSGKWKDRSGNDNYEFVIEVPCQSAPVCDGSITGLKFYDINGGNNIALTDGSTYQLSQLPSQYNIEAMVSGNIESVKFFLSGNINDSHNENIVPYRFGGDNTPMTLTPGDYSLTVKAFINDNASGEKCDEKTVHFTIADEPVDCTVNCKREVSSTISCGGNGPYTIWLENAQGGNFFDGSAGTWEECEDGVIHYYGTATKQWEAQ